MDDERTLLPPLDPERLQSHPPAAEDAAPADDALAIVPHDDEPARGMDQPDIGATPIPE